MRGLFLVLALISLMSLVACGGSRLPAVPVTLTLKTDYKSLPAGSHSMLLVLPDSSLPEFLLITQPLGEEVLSIPQSAFSERMEFENRSISYEVQGASSDGIAVEGKLSTAYAYICEPKNPAGHRSCEDGNDYAFKGDLKRNGEIIGTIEGNIKR